MKTFFTKFLVLSISLTLLANFSKAQTGLDALIVEKYYVSNAADSIGSVGTLPVGSVTYRIFVDMKQGYKFQMAYGNSTHPLEIKTTTSFFNNEDYGATTPSFSKSNCAKNTVMLDSWLSAGAACVGYFGILKSEDNGLSNVVNTNGILHNNNPSAGIPLTTQDGLIAGTPGVMGTIGIDTEIAVFDATSQLGNSFSTTNGAWYCLAGAVGPDTTNKVLIAQLTTNGKLSFKLNIQIGTPDGGTELYVAENATGTEIQDSSLIFVSDTIPVTVGIKESVSQQDNSISISPNPSHGIFKLEINSENQNSENYYKVYNLLGNILFEKNLPSTLNSFKENVDMTTYENGIYFIEVSINGDKNTYKLIKN